MPTKMAKFCGEKGVLISVYEEKPRRRRIAASRQQQQQQHHHHHHHHHQHRYHCLYNDLDSAGTGKGYNRRAELLQYSRTLRESPQPSPAASTPLLLKPKPTPTSSKFQPPSPKTVAVQRKPSSAKTPTCLGDWKILIPSFVRSLISLKGKKDGKKKKPSGSGTNKMTALMKSIKVQKKRGFIPKLCSTLQKHR
ncbi:hypothetical protein KPL71_006864 [Citrus sinensis]|uniref:Uncharacterized protein n=1 Tax=Citrus sinensis TaxID=2711 RepID=A0ACB8LU48_CITSI|nr:hypothetical protein KPL71_006864 [Citrus sinensis]